MYSTVSTIYNIDGLVAFHLVPVNWVLLSHDWFSLVCNLVSTVFVVPRVSISNSSRYVVQFSIAFVRDFPPSSKAI
jgi:hypothetical protein